VAASNKKKKSLTQVSSMESITKFNLDILSTIDDRP